LKDCIVRQYLKITTSGRNKPETFLPEVLPP
jgi:hypothetical protein